MANSVLAGGISPLGACGGSPLQVGTAVRKKEKFAAALWEMVGQSRTRRAHKTVVDQPPGLSRFSAFFLNKYHQNCCNCSRWTQIDGPINCGSYHGSV